MKILEMLEKIPVQKMHVKIYRTGKNTQNNTCDDSKYLSVREKQFSKMNETSFQNNCYNIKKYCTEIILKLI